MTTLSTISKLLEQHVKNLILDHICNTYPISDHQWGFMHHRSSISALISVIYDWLYALDSGLEVCVVFFDVQKAFDSVPHLPLLQKFEEIGINQFILKWIQSNYTGPEARRLATHHDTSCARDKISIPAYISDLVLYLFRSQIYSKTTFLARFQILRGRTDQRSLNQPEMLTFDSL